MTPSLLSTASVEYPTALHWLDTAEHMASHSLPSWEGKTMANLFWEASTRTRLSFEVAAKRLKITPMNFSAQGSSTAKGESLKDTVQTLEAMGTDVVVLRHPASGAAQRLTQWTHASVVNAGDGTHEHPTQALTDAMVIRRAMAQRRGDEVCGTDLQGVHILIVGDALHSRIVRSHRWLLPRLGARVTLVMPPTLRPPGVETWPCAVEHDLDRALAARPDVVMMLRVQKERMTASYFPSWGEYARMWGLSEERWLRCRTAHGERPILMHPGPMNRGIEIAASAADDPSSHVLEQVRCGVYLRMAVLHWALTSSDERDPKTEVQA